MSIGITNYVIDRLSNLHWIHLKMIQSHCAYIYTEEKVTEGDKRVPKKIYQRIKNYQGEYCVAATA